MTTNISADDSFFSEDGFWSELLAFAKEVVWELLDLALTLAIRFFVAAQAGRCFA